MQPKLSVKKNHKYFVPKIFYAALFWIVFLPVSIVAADLNQYHENIRNALELTDSLLYPEDENVTAEKAQASEAEILTAIRKSVADSEKIEWQNTTFETDNQWLKISLDEYAREAQNSPKRRQILIAIDERLDSLDQKLDELENSSATNQSQTDARQKLTEILSREEFQKPEQQNESFFQKMYRQLLEVYRKIIEWLDSFFPKPNLSANSASGFQSFSFVLQILLYALILGIIGFLIYKFAPFIAGRFRPKYSFKKKERVVLGERLSAEETAENLFSEAENLAREGNLRAAIRKGYIALLCELGDRKIINLSSGKTNRDYLRDVRNRAELYQNMSGLTQNFERHWYGFAPTDEIDWEEFKNGYQKAVRSGQ